VLFVVAFLVILGGVCWSAYVAWHGPTPATTASIALEFIVTPDPGIAEKAACRRQRCVAGHRGDTEIAGSNSIPYGQKNSIC
jgi:hypothetical protein